MHTPSFTHTFTYTLTHTATHSHTHIHTHTHTHTHTQSLTLTVRCTNSKFHLVGSKIVVTAVIIACPPDKHYSMLNKTLNFYARFDCFMLLSDWHWALCMLETYKIRPHLNVYLIFKIWNWFGKLASNAEHFHCIDLGLFSFWTWILILFLQYVGASEMWTFKY